MEYKVGDKVLCKKDYKVFICGRYYTVTEKRNYKNYAYDIYIKTDDSKEILFNEDDTFWDPRLFDYFYTKEEERKLKLKKIWNIK